MFCRLCKQLAPRVDCDAYDALGRKCCPIQRCRPGRRQYFLAIGWVGKRHDACEHRRFAATGPARHHTRPAIGAFRGKPCGQLSQHPLSTGEVPTPSAEFRAPRLGHPVFRERALRLEIDARAKLRTEARVWEQAAPSPHVGTRPSGRLGRVLLAEVAVDRLHHVVHCEERLGMTPQPPVAIGECLVECGGECALFGLLFRSCGRYNEDRRTASEDRREAVRDLREFGCPRACIARIEDHEYLRCLRIFGQRACEVFSRQGGSVELRQ